jgi:hypothetical protein
MKIDTNTKGHQNWYSFKLIINSDSYIKFNICNFRKLFTLYSKGLKPYLYNP